MAARKRSAVGKGTMPASWRNRIRTSMLVNRLTDHIDGKVDMKNSQVTAALGLLKKTIPDLSSVALAGDPNNNAPLTIKWAD